MDIGPEPLYISMEPEDKSPDYRALLTSSAIANTNLKCVVTYLACKLSVEKSGSTIRYSLEEMLRRTIECLNDVFSKMGKMHIEWKKRTEHMEREIESMKLQIDTGKLSRYRNRPNFVHRHSLQQGEIRSPLGGKLSPFKPQTEGKCVSPIREVTPWAVTTCKTKLINPIKEEPASFCSSDSDLDVKEGVNKEEEQKKELKRPLVQSAQTMDIEKLYGANARGGENALRETRVELELYKSLSEAFKEELMKRREQIEKLNAHAKNVDRINEDLIKENSHNWQKLVDKVKV